MKLKLTAVDGSRVRRVGVAWFGSSRTEEYGESGLMVLTNQGDVHVVSLPGIKLQVHYSCIRREDVSGIASCVFTKHGQGKHTPPYALLQHRSRVYVVSSTAVVTQAGPLRNLRCCGFLSGFYLMSPSEFERFSLSTRNLVQPHCLVEVPLYSAPSTQRRPDRAAQRYSTNGFLHCIAEGARSVRLKHLSFPSLSFQECQA